MFIIGEWYKTYYIGNCFIFYLLKNIKIFEKKFRHMVLSDILSYYFIEYYS